MEQAIALDAAAVVVNLLRLPNQPDLHYQGITNIAHLKPQCERAGMPLIVEPLVMRDNSMNGGYMVDGDFDKILPLVRQACELGADIIKADPCDNVNDYHRIIEIAGRPVLLRGGGKATENEVLQRTFELMQQGAKGIVYGRNIIQHENPSGMVRVLMAIVHDGANAEEAMEILQQVKSEKMTKKRRIKFAIIGCGLMGREFAVATTRWPALLETTACPEIVAICDVNKNLFGWYTDNFDSIKTTTTNYQDLLSDNEIDAIYCAVPHNLHEKIYIDIIKAGKHLMGEKPFGIDLEANKKIMQAIRENPGVFVRCSSEFPYYPGAHQIHNFIRENQWGKIIEVNAGFLHSSDVNFNKPINWKRMIEINGEYGCMGDLGMHVLHIPIRSGWIPKRISASLSNIVNERPDGKGGMVPCKTWDNATLSCLVDHPLEKYSFPMTLKTYRFAPGEIDTWYLEVIGTEFSVRYSTKYPKTLQTMRYENGGKQEWRYEDLGYTSVLNTITGGIFEFGFSDAILQMWGSFVEELTNAHFNKVFGCITPEETLVQHQILTASLNSGKTGNTQSLL